MSSETLIDTKVNDSDYGYVEESNWERTNREVAEKILQAEKYYLANKKAEIELDNYKEQKELEEQADEEYYQKTHNDLDL